MEKIITREPRKYRIRQCAAAFLLELNDWDGLEWYWQIVDSGYSWSWAEETAEQYDCEII